MALYNRPGSSTPKKGNPYAPAPPGTAPPKTVAPKPVTPKAPNPFVAPETDDPFNPRRERLWNMDPGAARNRARQDLRGDVRRWTRAEQANAYDPNDWGNDNAYLPGLVPPTAGTGGFGLDPTHNYGNPAGGFLDTGIGKAWIGQNPQAYYGLAQAQAGNPTDDTTAYGRYLRNQYENLYSQYGAAQGISPNLSWNKYLAGVMPQMERQYRTTPYQLRGDIPTVGGSATWLGGF